MVWADIAQYDRFRDPMEVLVEEKLQVMEARLEGVREDGEKFMKEGSGEGVRYRRRGGMGGKCEGW